MSRDLFGKLQAQRGDVPVQTIQMNTMDTFQREVDEIERNMAQVRVNIDELDKLQKRALNTISDSEASTLERQLERITAETNELNNHVSEQLKSMQAVLRQLPSDAETAMRRNLHSALTRKFMGTLTEYQNSQKRNRDACRDRFIRQYRIVNPNATQDEIESKLQGTGGQQLFSNQLLESTRSQRAKLALHEVEERHKEVERIGQSSVQVNQLFVDLQRMVDQQGETLDRIEDNVNSAAVQLEQGTTHLEKAVDSARASRRKRWCLFFLIMIILIVVIVVVLINVLPKTSAPK
jgi:syntaxin 1B/2/3